MMRRFPIHRATSSRRSADEHGETLLETIISLLLIASVVMAVVFGILTVMRVSNQNRKLVRAGNESVVVAEQIKRVHYKACGGSSAPLDAYRDTIQFSVPGYEATLKTVRFLKQNAANTPPAGDSFQSGCGGVDQGVQELVVELNPTTSDGLEQELTFYKRRDHCPGQNSEFEGQQC